MTFSKVQLCKKAAENSKRANRKEPFSEGTLATVWEAIEAWIISQLELTKGAGIPNFAKLGWVNDPALPAPKQPLFVLLDSFARAHALHCGRGAVLASTANRGWSLGTVEEMNFSKVAIRFSKGLSKDAVFQCTRLLLQALGEAVASSQLVDLRLGVGSLRARGRKVEFAFDEQYARGRAPRSGAAHVPASASLPGSRPRSGGSDLPSCSRPPGPGGSPGPDGADARSEHHRLRQPQAEQQRGPHAKGGMSQGAAESACSLRGEAGAGFGLQISGCNPQPREPQLADGAGGRKKGPAGRRAAQRMQDGVECCMMQGSHLRPPPPEKAEAMPASCPYGTELDVGDGCEQQRRGRHQSQRRHFPPQKSHIGPGADTEKVQQEAHRGRKTSNFSAEGSEAYADALERHRALKEKQESDEKGAEAALWMRKLELDKQARSTVRQRRSEQKRLAGELQEQMHEHDSQRAMERLSPGEAVALIEHRDPHPEARQEQAERYRQELDRQVMEKTLTKEALRTREQSEELAMLADAEEDLVSHVESEHERVRAAQAKLREEWGRQISEARQARDRGRSAGGSRQGPRAAAAGCGNPLAGSLLAPW